MFTWVSSHLLQRVLAQLMDQTAEVWNNGSFPNKEIVNEVNQTRRQYTLCLLYKTLSCSWQTTEIKTWMMHWSNDELCLVYGNKEQRNNSNWIWIFKFKLKSQKHIGILNTGGKSWASTESWGCQRSMDWADGYGIIPIRTWGTNIWALRFSRMFQCVTISRRRASSWWMWSLPLRMDRTYGAGGAGGQGQCIN